MKICQRRLDIRFPIPQFRWEGTLWLVWRSSETFLNFSADFPSRVVLKASHILTDRYSSPFTTMEIELQTNVQSAESDETSEMLEVVHSLKINWRKKIFIIVNIILSVTVLALQVKEFHAI